MCSPLIRSAICKLQSRIQTKNWDCLLMYMCSSKLPKLTVSFWEQSLHNKAEIPTW